MTSTQMDGSIIAKEQKYREKLTDRMVNFSMSSLAVGCVRFPCNFRRVCIVFGVLLIICQMFMGTGDAPVNAMDPGLASENTERPLGKCSPTENPGETC